MKKIVVLFLASLSVLAHAQVAVPWSPEFRLPSLDGARENPGVARAYAGETNGKVLLAGGANFPDGCLWRRVCARFGESEYLFHKILNSTDIVGQLSRKEKNNDAD